jgi:hypothetical protein
MSLSALIADCVLLNLSNKKSAYKKLIELDSKQHFQLKTKGILQKTKEIKSFEDGRKFSVIEP